jgi:hypothetical protein
MHSHEIVKGGRGMRSTKTRDGKDGTNKKWACSTYHHRHHADADAAVMLVHQQK